MISETTQRVFISLGGNQGDVSHTFSLARSAIAALEKGVQLVACSSMYTTEPQEYSDQPWFHNQVLELACDSSISPHALLSLLLNLEHTLGRVRDPSFRFGPRRIDIDMLLWGSVILQDESLVIPHPRMHQRAFVLVPLLEIDPYLCFPNGNSLRAALSELQYSVAGDVIRQEG